jgi:iron complex transport system ATP-binding protein
MTMVIEMNEIGWYRDNKIIVDGINWQVAKGEHWAILGLNGSGKTTLLNMINGYIWPTKGQLSVLGNPFGSVDIRELRKSIGWVSSSLQEKLYASDKTQHVVISGKHASILRRSFRCLVKRFSFVAAACLPKGTQEKY